MSMSNEQEAESRWFANQAAKQFKAGELTQDQMRKKVMAAFKYHDWPYLEELQRQEIGEIVWRWKK